MADTAQELERLVVRLVGEASQYQQVLDDACSSTDAAAAQIQHTVDNTMGANNRAMLEAASATTIATKQVEAFAAATMATTPAAEAELGALNMLRDAEKGTTTQTAKLTSETKKLTAAETTAASTTKVATSALKESGLTLRDVGGKVKGMGAELHGYGTMLTLGVTLPLLAAASAAVSMAAHMATIRLRLAYAFSPSVVDPLLDKLDQLKTPFQYEALIGATQTLKAFGIENEKLIGTLKMVGDVAAASGADINELAVMYGRAKSAGVVGGLELREITHQMPAIAKELTNVLGISMQEMKKAGEESRIPFEALQEAFRRVTAEGGKFAGAMVKFADTPEGHLMQLEEDVKGLARGIGFALMPYAEQLVAWAREMVPYLGNLIITNESLILKILGVAAVIGPLVVGFGYLTSMAGNVITVLSFLNIQSLGGLFTGLYNAFKAVWAFIAAIGPWVAAIGLVAAAVVFLTDAISGGQLGVIKWVESIRVGGASIGMWFTYASITAFKAWAWLATSLDVVWNDMLYSFREFGSMLWRGMLKVVQAIAQAFWWVVGKVTNAVGYLTGKVVDLLAYVGLVSEDTQKSAHAGAKLASESIKDIAQEATQFYQDKVDESLGATEDRWAKHNKMINGLQKDYQDQMGIYNKTIDTGFAKDQKEYEKQQKQASGAVKAPGLPNPNEFPEGAIEKWVGGLLPEKDKKEMKEKHESQETDFKQVALNRVSVAGLTGFGKPRRQPVEAPGVESRLDKLIALQSNQKPVLGY